LHYPDLAIAMAATVSAVMTCRSAPRRRGASAGTLIALVGSAILFVGCKGSSAHDAAPADAGGRHDDAAPDAAPADGDAGNGDVPPPDTAGDAMSEVPAEVGGDAMSDLPAEVGADATSDVPADVGADGGTLEVGTDRPGGDDAATDGGPDGRPAGPWSTLRLVAGGLGGVGNANEIGGDARFASPIGVVVDGAGNLYVADGGNSVIRQLTLATGAVTTLAGMAGVSGTANGAGAAARFRGPNGLALDGAGNLFVADTGNHVIRKIVLATATVTTVAGSAGEYGSVDAAGGAARLRSPVGLAWDGGGSLYFTDAGNSTVRKLELATGMVTTLAGTAGMPGSADGTGAAARFADPRGLALDGAGNLFLVDTSFPSLIRKLVLATGEVTTVAGGRTSAFGADGIGTAASFDNPADVTYYDGNLYVADSGHTIRRVEVATARVTTISGSWAMSDAVDGIGTAARLFGPDGIVSDGKGTLYIADTDNRMIRSLVLATGALSTLAGAPQRFGSVDGTGAAARFYQPVSIVADGAGSLYVAEFGNATVRKVALATGQVTTLAGSPRMYATTDGTGAAARFRAPAGMVLDGAGDLYVTDSSDHVIRRVTVATGAVTTFLGAAGMRGSTDASGSAARFSGPRGVVSDGAGTLYVADTDNSTIRKVVVATRTVTTVAGEVSALGSVDGRGTAARFAGPQDIVLASDGNLYVADTGNNTIRKIVLATGDVTTLAGTASPTGGSVDGTGAAARFYTPRGITADAAGNLFVAEMRNAAIRRVTPAGVVTTPIGVFGRTGVKTGPLPAGLNQPIDVFLLASGELAICEGLEHAILIAAP
jgi:sugar lactone lactonase YvrE